jgi:nucleoside-diphosphate kinase
MLDKTLVLIKPDGVKRHLIGEIITRFEKVGMKIAGMKLVWVDKAHAMKHYTDDITKRRGEHVRNKLLDFIVEGPVVALCLEGVEVVEVVRKMVGDTQPKTALPGTIRGDYAHMSYGYSDAQNKAIPNLIHASSNKEEAKTEVDLWFTAKELHSYKLPHEDYIL